MFSSSGNKHSSRSSHHQSGWASSRWPGSRTAAGAGTSGTESAASRQSSMYDSSWELSHGCEVAELSDVPVEWKDLTG